MRITFYGACESVTGSQHLINANNKNILLECGLYQGRRKDSERINRHFPFDPKAIDAVVLSHAHIDHSGNLPNLVKQGFQGNIYCTNATASLLEPMLLDSAKIQEHDIEYLKKRIKNQVIPLEPIYTEQDATKVMPLCVKSEYGKWIQVAPGIQLLFQNAGHILGSALISLKINEGQKEIIVGYTGDLGRKNLPILQDPERMNQADILISECTYGDTLHDDIKTSSKKLAEAIQKTYQRGGKVIIPSFAIERAQELMYILHILKDTGQIPHEIQIYVDSPLIVKVVKIFEQYLDLYDEEARQYFTQRGENPFVFSGLHLIEDTHDSMALNQNNEPCIIISASGMCEFGRIRHHLKNTIENPNNTICIVGFMAKHTLGRKLLRGEKEVVILDKRLRVNAEIKVFNSLSAHADQKDLSDFITGISGLKTLFLVHGEEKSKNAFTELVKNRISAQIISAQCGVGYEF